MPQPSVGSASGKNTHCCVVLPAPFGDKTVNRATLDIDGFRFERKRGEVLYRLVGF